MSNKLQELTDKLYNEGLSKGKEEGELLLAQARVEADKIRATGRREAALMVAEAEKSAAALKEKKRFTAVFAFSDELAVGAMAALYDAGLRVPEDVSVLGYDDLTIATRVRPALTTVHQPIDAFVQRSLELFSQPSQALHAEILLPHSIVERQSCRRVGDPVPKPV